LFSGLSSISTVRAGKASNALLSGANTVNGPLISVSTKPAAITAATSVVCSFEFTAFSTMFFVLYIAAPPTIKLSIDCAETPNVTPSVKIASANNDFI
jgi:hypothetical protein